MNFKKFFILQNYISRLNQIKKNIIIILLKIKIYRSTSSFNIWKIDYNHDFTNLDFSTQDVYYVFGIPVNLKQINWHKDRFSNFVYPLERFNKLKIPKYFNKGIDVVFPWEQSRFYFGIHLAQKYLATHDKYHYSLFKDLVIDWISKNPFMYGVNWTSTMDVAIRAVNWIVSINLFYNVFKQDKDFEKIITKNLAMHAEYISSFPLIEAKGLTTNHTTAAYTGLLFLSLALKEHPNSNKWLTAAIEGLEDCIENQTYEDGVNFEGSIPYHRLVLEMFAYSAIIAIHNNLRFSNNYFKKLFKMFEYTAAYLDQGGNAPQVGDNDSGRLMIFNSGPYNNPYDYEHKHSYLLSLGYHIFKYRFPSQCANIDDSILKYLPTNDKEINVDNLKLVKRETNKSIKFGNGGSYLLKNNNYFLHISCFPMGQKGKGGHNNFDTGSFTLSIKDKQFIVDPGTFTYSRNKNLRDKFRAYEYHNTIFTEKDTKIDFSQISYWGLKNYYKCKIIEFNNNRLNIEISSHKNEIRKRKFLLTDNYIILQDESNGEFFSNINLHPEIKIIKADTDKIITNIGSFTILNAADYVVRDYFYSPHYGKILLAKSILFKNTEKSKIIIKIEKQK